MRLFLPCSFWQAEKPGKRNSLKVIEKFQYIWYMNKSLADHLALRGCPAKARLNLFFKKFLYYD